MIIHLVYDQSFDDVLREEGINLMLSFAVINKDPFSVKIPEGFKKVMIDSGGFQLQTGVKTGRDISLSAYAAWLKFAVPKYPEIVAYMNMDILGDTAQSIKNMEWLESEGLHPLPVWHPGEGMELLDKYCKKYPYIAVGGIAGKAKRNSADMKPMFESILTRHPETKFHLLGIGITASTALRSFRPYSVDFSTWVNVYKFGHGLDWDKDGLLREYQLPQEDRDRIRVDKEFKKKVVRETIKKLKIFADRIEEFHDPHQIQFDMG